MSQSHIKLNFHEDDDDESVKRIRAVIAIVIAVFNFVPSFNKNSTLLPRHRDCHIVQCTYGGDLSDEGDVIIKKQALTRMQTTSDMKSKS